MSWSKRGCIFGTIIGLLLFATPMCLAGLIVWNMTHVRVIKEWKQPLDVEHQRGKFVLRVVEIPDWDWLGLRTTTQLFVANTLEADHWNGYYFDVEFSPSREDLDDHVGRSKVNWTKDGIEFKTPTGEKQFVPAEKFDKAAR